MGGEGIAGLGLSVGFGFARWRFSTVPHKIADAGLIAGMLLLIIGTTMPTVHLSPLVAVLFVGGCLCLGAAAHLAIKDNAAQKPSPQSLAAIVAPAQANPSAPPRAPAIPYYTRPEIDKMLAALTELQRSARRRAAPYQMTRIMTGVLKPPELSEFLATADALDQFAEGLKNDAQEMQRIANDSDEFVKSALPPLLPAGVSFQLDPLYSSSTRAAEILRDFARETTSNKLAGAAVAGLQRDFYDNYRKYSESISSTQQKISEKITDLRSR